MKPRQPDERGLLGRVGGTFLVASPLRTGVEAVALAAVLCLGVFLTSYGQKDGNTLASVQVYVVGPLSAMLAAGRMRLEGGGWREILLREGVFGVILMVVVAALGMATTVAVRGLHEGGAQFVSFLIVFGLFLWSLGAFAFFRTLAHLWPRWVGLRRSRLRWEMTHTTLTVVAAISSVVILVTVPFYVLAVLRNSTFSLTVGFAFILVGILIFLTVVALALILPPAALVSYFAARRTARRLESLTHGTSGLREGNFDIRVEVDGEDEVSDLQKDFNAMAGDLESAMRDLRSERDNVERLLRTQRELVASVSHELRTPVATMRGYLESALDGERKEHPIPENLRDDLKIMGREVVRLQRLIDDLFTLSRTETGNLPLKIQPTDVSALLARCAEAASESAWRTGRVKVIRDAGANAGANLPQVLADEGRLEQVVRNLLSNAVRHTPPGGIVALSEIPEPDAVVIEVKDTGEGISPGDLDHVFERFYRSDGVRRSDHSGAGLGLALVKELVEAMDGTVRVESEPGSGSRFVLRLPHA